MSVFRGSVSRLGVFFGGGFLCVRMLNVTTGHLSVTQA